MPHWYIKQFLLGKQEIKTMHNETTKHLIKAIHPILLFYKLTYIRNHQKKVTVTIFHYLAVAMHLIESRPQRLKTVHKYSRTLISLLQRTTNQDTPLASTLKKPESFTASTYARITRISTIARILGYF